MFYDLDSADEEEEEESSEEEEEEGSEEQVGEKQKASTEAEGGKRTENSGQIDEMKDIVDSLNSKVVIQEAASSSSQTPTKEPDSDSSGEEESSSEEEQSGQAGAKNSEPKLPEELVKGGEKTESASGTSSGGPKKVTLADIAARIRGGLAGEQKGTKDEKSASSNSTNSKIAGLEEVKSDLFGPSSSGNADSAKSSKPLFAGYSSSESSEERGEQGEKPVLKGSTGNSVVKEENTVSPPPKGDTIETGKQQETSQNSLSASPVVTQTVNTQQTVSTKIAKRLNKKQKTLRPRGVWLQRYFRDRCTVNALRRQQYLQWKRGKVYARFDSSGVRKEKGPAVADLVIEETGTPENSTSDKKKKNSPVTTPPKSEEDTPAKSEEEEDADDIVTPHKCSEHTPQGTPETEAKKRSYDETFPSPPAGVLPGGTSEEPVAKKQATSAKKSSEKAFRVSDELYRSRQATSLSTQYGALFNPISSGWGDEEEDPTASNKKLTMNETIGAQKQLQQAKITRDSEDMLYDKGKIKHTDKTKKKKEKEKWANWYGSRSKKSASTSTQAFDAAAKWKVEEREWNAKGHQAGG